MEENTTGIWILLTITITLRLIIIILILPFPDFKIYSKVFVNRSMFQMSLTTTCESMEYDVWVKVDSFEPTRYKIGSQIKIVDDLKRIIFDHFHQYKYHAIFDGRSLLATNPVPSDTSYERPIELKKGSPHSCE